MLNSSTVSNSFYNSTVNSGLTGNGDYGEPITDIAGTVHGLTTSEMTNSANFTGATTANGSVNPNWNFSSIWGVNSTINGGNPYLLAIAAAAPPSTLIYLNLMSGSSVYGSAPTYTFYTGSGTPTAGTYFYYTSPTYGSGSPITDASPTGTIAWSGAPTSTSSVASSPYSVSYSTGITLGNSAYTLAGGNAASWTVTPLALVAGTLAGSSVYGSALSISPVIFSNVINGDQVYSSSSINVAINSTNHLSHSGYLNAGTYAGALSVGNSLAGNNAGNYSFAGLTGNYTVSQLALTGAITTGSSVYGSTLKPGAVTFTNKVSGDTVSSAGIVTVNTTDHTSTSVHLNAGTYTGIESVNSSLSGVDAGNYTFAGLTGNYTVSQLALTGAIATGSSVYGWILKPGAARFTNMVGSDKLGTATVAVNTAGNASTNGNLTAGNHSGVESVSALSGADAGNYSFAGLKGAYNVSKLALTGTIATGSSVYGAVLTPGAVSFNNLITGDTVTAGTVSINKTGKMSASGRLNAGTYTGIESVGSVLSGKDAGNYTFAGAKGNYSVSKLALTVTANNQTRLYGAINPTFAETISGFISGENSSVVTGTGTARGSSSANTTTAKGASVITANNTGLSAANYTFSHLVNGILTIK